MKEYLFKEATIINEGEIYQGDLLIENNRIARIGSSLSHPKAEVIEAEGKWLLPGVIDDQVHFREPGLTHKAEILTEARAAVAGGVTSYMEMPNTNPQALTQELLEDKYQRASQVSVANYSFFMGASNHNLEEVLRTDSSRVCGIKIFMGSSTGDMLVDDDTVLERIFQATPMLIATHCEDEQTVRANLQAAREKYGEDIPIEMHPVIRDEEACYLSSSKAVSLARKHGARLHVLHISTAKELELFDQSIPLKDKKITSEACIHHLWFTDAQYATLGSLIKWNPAVKKASDRDAIRDAVNSNLIDVMATDHAPHTLEEKQNKYLNCPSGGPLIQHSLQAALELVKQGVFSLEKIVEKMCHHPAILFRIEDRGFIREGYFADLVLVNPDMSYKVDKSNILAKCGWSPFEGQQFAHTIEKTFVNGHLAYDQGEINDAEKGMRLSFNN